MKRHLFTTILTVVFFVFVILAFAGESEPLLEERKVIKDMWADLMRLYTKHDSNPAISDEAISRIFGLSGEVGYIDILVETLMKNEDNPEQSEWIAGYIRKLADFGRKIDPALGENETRKNNLEVVKGWMDSFHESTFFDNDILVGMYKFKGDREKEKYNRNEKTKDHYHSGIRYYEEALKRANTVKARADFYHALSFLHSRYKSKNKAERIRQYKKGFDHAKAGLDLLKNDILKSNSKYYPYEKENKILLDKMQKDYGNNYTGYVYNLYLAKDYKTVVDARGDALKIPSSHINSGDSLLLIAESAKELALKQKEDSTERKHFATICLNFSDLAFLTVYKKDKGKLPEYNDKDFCKYFNARWHYLKKFGLESEHRDFEIKFEHLCP